MTAILELGKKWYFSPKTEDPHVRGYTMDLDVFIIKPSETLEIS